VNEAMVFIQDSFKNLPKELSDKQHNSKMAVFELYDTEQRFINDMAALNINRVVNIAKEVEPNAFIDDPFLEEGLIDAYGNYTTPVAFPFDEFLENEFEGVSKKIIDQMQSEEFVENRVRKLSYVTANQNVFRNFFTRLMNDVSGDNRNILEGNGNFNNALLMQYIKPAQRFTKYPQLLSDISKVYDLGSSKDNIKKHAEAINKFIADHESTYTVVESMVKRISETRLSRTEIITDRMGNALKDDILVINNQLDKVSNKASNQQQLAGLVAFKVELLELQVKVKELTPDSGHISKLEPQIKDIYQKVKKSHPGFKRDSAINRVFENARTSDAHLESQFKSQHYMKNANQFNTVKAEQIKTLDIAINALIKAEKRMERKLENKPNNQKYEAKRQGLRELKDSYLKMREDVIHSDQTIFGSEERLGQKMDQKLKEVKANNKHLTSGFFSYNKKVLNKISKHAHARQKAIDQLVKSYSKARAHSDELKHEDAVKASMKNKN